MIQAVLWLWGLARALQRPLVGQPCPWCGRTDSTVSREEIAVAVGETLRQLRQAELRVVDGAVTVTVPEGADIQQAMDDVNFQLRRAKRGRPDDDPPAPTGVPT